MQLCSMLQCGALGPVGPLIVLTQHGMSCHDSICYAVLRLVKENQHMLGMDGAACYCSFAPFTRQLLSPGHLLRHLSKAYPETGLKS